MVHRRSLSVGQIYLLSNALLAEPLRASTSSHACWGIWGTTPGLNMLYVHLNRVIRRRDLNMMHVIGPGHGGPAIAANTWLGGSYSETYPDVPRDEHGMNHLFRQFSFPGGPSHVAPELPGSIHEGGELGYSLSHAYGAVLDNPDLVVACVIGDGEAETGPLAASWHSNKFIDPRTDGVVLPILHLNGYKIANPIIFAYHGLPGADSPPGLPPTQPRQPARPRLQRRRHDHNALRHGRAQRPRPVPPRDKRDRPRARSRPARGCRPAMADRPANPAPRIHPRARRRPARGS